MKPETTEWIDKAEGDWSVAQREMRTANPVWNVVSFLAQQCAEKYLKAFLEGITSLAEGFMTLWFCLTQPVDDSQSLIHKNSLWPISALLVWPRDIPVRRRTGRLQKIR